MQEKSIQQVIQADVNKILGGIKRFKDDQAARINAIRDALREITRKYTTFTYDFNLAMDVFVEAAYKNFSDCLEIILSEFNLQELNDEELSAAFACYYALSLIYKKENSLEKLKTLLEDKYSELNRFPLRLEVFSRYYKRVGELRTALEYDRRAIKILGGRGVINVALCISYASTVSSMLEKHDKSLTAEEIFTAEQYVEQAIAFNEKYPKYYFIKAKILFYKAINSKLPDKIIPAGKQAINLIESNAEALLYEMYFDNNVFISKTREKYDNFKKEVILTLNDKKFSKFIVKNSELDRIKAEILTSDCHKKCATSNFLPPRPTLFDGDKFIFFYYSSSDYKSVYCDLIELYKRKIHFKYDSRLTEGTQWTTQIENFVKEENCVGVVCFLSKNTVKTESSVYKEIEITRKHGKPHACINLEDGLLPSILLQDYLAENFKPSEGKYMPGAQMADFLTFFPDDVPFVSKFKDGKDDGCNHLNALMDYLVKRFSSNICGE